LKISQKNRLHRYNIRPQGLGIIITQLSFVLATQRSAVAVVPNPDNVVYDLKRIFAIPDSRLVIEMGVDGLPDLETDELCTYAPYFYSDTVNLFGQQYSTARKKKPCVALAMHHGLGLGNSKSMPYNKFATANDYNQTFQKLTEFGYDVITMNQRDMSLEQKIYVLNELCDFVIGYEGGLHHLAHVLKIPCVVFPWQYNDAGDDPVYPGMYYETHRFQPDRRTWFLKTVNEFLAWSPAELAKMIDGLHNQLGNNILFDADTTVDPDTLTITAGNGMDLTPRIMWCETRGKYTTAFVKEHLAMENMVKYPVKSMTYNT
jgi:hypothetical protein